MNDLEKLNKVIESLEEQAREVEEFKGVLRAVNDARSEIDESKAVLTSLAGDHRLLIQNQSRQLDDFLKRFAKFEKNLADVQKTQGELVSAINQLNVVSCDQFQQGQDKLMGTLALLDRTVHALHEEAKRAGQDALNASVEDQTQQLMKALEAQRASLRILSVITMVVLLVLATGVAFMAY